MRWQHPERGLLAPDEFIPLAEATGLDSGADAVSCSMRRSRSSGRGIDDGLDIRVAVNLSARDLYDLTLPETVARLLADHGVPPSSLELEITESVIVADPMRARAILSRLSEMGVVLAIDDYGTGYSSLGYLKRLPVDQMKIDRSFVMQMADDRERRGDRALDGGAGAEPRAAGRRRGCRDRRCVDAFEGARLRLRAGLLPQPAGARRRDRRARARKRRGRPPRRRRLGSRIVRYRGRRAGP